MSFDNSHLCVAVPPSFTVGLVDKVVFEGDRLVLKCQADSAPPPQYTWYRGSITLDGIDRYDTSTPGMLKTTDVGRDQAGTYNCSVSSVDNGVMVGRNSTTARVFVVCKFLCVYCRPSVTSSNCLLILILQLQIVYINYHHCGKTGSQFYAVA